MGSSGLKRTHTVATHDAEYDVPEQPRCTCGRYMPWNPEETQVVIPNGWVDWNGDWVQLGPDEVVTEYYYVCVCGHSFQVPPNWV